MVRVAELRGSESPRRTLARHSVRDSHGGWNAAGRQAGRPVPWRQSGQKSGQPEAPLRKTKIPVARFTCSSKEKWKLEVTGIIPLRFSIISLVGVGLPSPPTRTETKDKAIGLGCGTLPAW